MSGRSRAFLKLAALAALVAAGILLAHYTPLGRYLSRDGVEAAVARVRGNPWAPVLFVAAYAGATALALPGSVLTLAGGALFGFGWGVLFNTLGANLGANAAFLLARWLGRGGVERLAGERLEKLDRATRSHGFRGLLTLRLIPAVPFNALNFGSGLTAISWSTYAVATAVGIFPGTVVYTLFADALLQGSVEASRRALIRVLVAGALLVLLSFLPMIVKKLNPKISGGISILVVALAATCALPTAGRAAPRPERVAGILSGTTASEASARPVPLADSLPDPAPFTRALQAHVDVDRGQVDYGALKADRGDLDRYVRLLAATDSSELAASSRTARLAFWINAYNACMLELVIDHYPLTETHTGLVDRIKNLLADRPSNSVWRIPDVFTRTHCDVAGKKRSQDAIEHGILRPMGEPRIHFAVNCAATSCPVLSDQAYTARRLDAQLDRQVRRFVSSPRQFSLQGGSPPVLTVNRVLDWYGQDFGGANGVKAFFVPYVTAEQRPLLENPDTRVEFFDYDWTLNDRTR